MRNARNVVGAAFAFALLAVPAACGDIRTDNALYNQLSDIMEERKRLWFTPRDEGGTRERDISGLVCPLVAAEALDEMYSDPAIAKTMARNYYETTASGAFPNKSTVWSIKKRIDLLTNQGLGIVIADEEGCSARYGHYK